MKMEEFAENVEKVNGSLSELEGALEKQTELLSVNRQLIASMDGLQTVVTDSNDQMVVELRALTSEMGESTKEISNLVQGVSSSQLKKINSEIKKQVSNVSNQTNAALSEIKSKIKNDNSNDIRKLSVNQAAILSSLQAVTSQNDEIKQRFEEQQDRISFP